MDKIVIIDRDGVINVNKNNYVKTWKEFKFIKFSKIAIKLLNENGFKIIVISNQSAIGRGLTTIKEVENIHQNMIKELEKIGAHLDAIYYCHHKPEDYCDCRKPKTGLLRQAMIDLNIKLNDAWLIGDSSSDIELGNNIGCKTILVLTGLGKETLKEQNVTPTYVKNSLYTAVKFITSI